METKKWVIENDWFHEDTWGLVESLHGLDIESIKQLGCVIEIIWWCDKIPLFEKME